MPDVPRQAREGLMRAWIAVLHERHPNVTWVAVEASATRDTVGEENNALASADQSSA